jgi:uncharacterized protein YfcZ (UPF0381/DUF406 family)
LKKLLLDCIKFAIQLIAVIALVVIIIFMFMSAFSCQATGVAVNPDTQEISTALKAVQDSVDKSQVNYGDIMGQLNTITQKITVIEQNVTNITSKVTKVQNSAWLMIAFGLLLLAQNLAWMYLEYLENKKAKK